MQMTHFFEDIQGEPDALRNILSSAIGENRNIYKQAANALSQHTALYIVGMGASWHAGMAVASFFHARKRTAVLFDAAELLYHVDLAENSCVLLLSRSGKNREVVDLVRDLHTRNVTIVSITNDPQSPMALESDHVTDLQSAFDRNVSVTMYSGIALTDYRVVVDVRFLSQAPAVVMGRINSSDVLKDEKSQLPSGYGLRVKPDGSWEILSFQYKRPTVTMTAGSAAIDRNQWHRLELSFHGKQIAASLDGESLAAVESSVHSHGMFALGTGWDHVQFDNLRVEP